MQCVRMEAAVMSGACVCVSDRRRLTGLSVWVCNNHSAYFSSSTQACQLSDPYWRQETYYTSAAQKHLFTELRCMTVCVCVCVSSSVCSICAFIHAGTVQTLCMWKWFSCACRLREKYMNYHEIQNLWFVPAVFKLHVL